MCVEGLDSIDALQRYMHKAARNAQVLGRERLASTAQLPGQPPCPQGGANISHTLKMAATLGLMCANWRKQASVCRRSA